MYIYAHVCVYVHMLKSICTYSVCFLKKKQKQVTNKRLMHLPTIALVCVYEDLCMNTSQYIYILTRTPTEYLVGSHQGTHVMYGGKVGGGAEEKQRQTVWMAKISDSPHDSLGL